MHRTNIVFIIFFTVLILSSFFFFMFYLNNDDNKMFKSKSPTIYSYNGVKLIPENAPALSNLFENIKGVDPHSNFKSSSECLKCHAVGIKINNGIDDSAEGPQVLNE